MVSLCWNLPSSVSSITTSIPNVTDDRNNTKNVVTSRFFIFVKLGNLVESQTGSQEWLRLNKTRKTCRVTDELKTQQKAFFDGSSLTLL